MIITATIIIGWAYYVLRIVLNAWWILSHILPSRSLKSEEIKYNCKINESLTLLGSRYGSRWARHVYSRSSKWNWEEEVTPTEGTREAWRQSWEEHRGQPGWVRGWVRAEGETGVLHHGLGEPKEEVFSSFQPKSRFLYRVWQNTMSPRSC